MKPGSRLKNQQGGAVAVKVGIGFVLLERGRQSARQPGRFVQKDKGVNVKEKGAAAVEFALAAIVFFTVLFAVIEFGYLFWVNLTMQHAVREGARFAVTGQQLTGKDPLGNTITLDRCTSAKEWIKEESMGLFDRVTSDTNVTFWVVDSSGNTTQQTGTGSGCGAPGDIIMIQIACAAPLLTPFDHILPLLTGRPTTAWQPVFQDGNYNFLVRATMKNEGF